MMEQQIIGLQWNQAQLEALREVELPALKAELGKQKRKNRKQYIFLLF